MAIIPFRQEEEIRREIRRAMIQDPMITIGRLQLHLAKKGFVTAAGNSLDWRFVKRLSSKVRAAAETYADRESQTERIAKTRERYNLVAERLFKIAFWDLDSLRELIPMPTVGEQVAALKAIVELDLKLFEAEKISGLFQDKGQQIIEGTWRYRPMPDEFYENVTKAFQAHGFGPERMKLISEAADRARAAAAIPHDATDNTSPAPAPASAAELGVVAG